MAQGYTVQRPVSMTIEGKPHAYHKVWYAHLDGAPVGAAFQTKAEATYELNHHYLAQERLSDTAYETLCGNQDYSRERELLG